MRKLSFCSLTLLWSIVVGILFCSSAPLYELHPDEKRCSKIEFFIIPVEDRISTRTFPSVFQAASPMWIEGIPVWDRFNDPELVPYHDLLFAGYIQYGDSSRIEFERNAAIGIDILLVKGVPQERHAYYHAQNPNFVSLYWWEFPTVDPGDAARGDLFPDESDYWMIDREGNRIPAGRSGSNLYLNFLDPEVQEILIKQVMAIASCGLFDGIMIDNFGGVRVASYLWTILKTGLACLKQKWRQR